MKDFAFINRLKFFFEADPKNLYKVCIRIIVPDSQDLRSMVISLITENLVYKQKDYQALRQKNHLGEKIYGNLVYNLFSIPEKHFECLIQSRSHFSNLKRQYHSTKDLQKADPRNYLRVAFSESQSRKIRAKIAWINKLGIGEDSSQKLCLRYLLQLGEILAQQILAAYKSNPNIFEGYDFKQTYLNLFQRFAVFDQKNLYPSIQKLLDLLFENIQDKSKFICQIFKDFLMKSEINYNQKNVIEFIQQQKNINFNDLIQSFNQVLNLENSSQSESSQITSQDQITKIFNDLEKKNHFEDHVSIHSILALLSIVDDLKTDENSTLDQLIILVTSLITKNTQVKDPKNHQGLLGIHYTLQVIHKLVKDPSFKIDQILEKTQANLITILILSLQREDQQVSKLRKQLFIDLAKKDTKGQLGQLLSQVLQWFKNKSNIKACHYYSKQDELQEGQGSGHFYKHLALVFKLYVKILKLQTKESDSSLQNAYKDLSNLMIELLEVLASSQNQANYEENFFVVWIQIYKSLGYLAQDNETNHKMIDLLAQNFFKLQPIHQELLYSKFHHVNEKQIKQTTSNDPQTIILLINSFINYGFEKQDNVKVTYCYLDGLFNILQSQQKEKTSPTQISCKFTSNQIYELAKICAQFLNNHCSFGVFTGVSGALIDTIMRLDLAIQMSSIILNAKDENNTTLFEVYVKSSQHQKSELIGSLLYWLFLNYSNVKGKSSPSGSRIYTLSTNIESIINLVNVSDEAVTECLPILMKSVLQTDYKLRDLINSNAINNERGIQIQRNVNTLFLSFFKQWVQTDLVAKKYLTELNGFDFLLDRLFSKTDTNQSVQNIVNAIDQDAEDSETDEENEEDQIMQLVMQKLNIKIPSTNQQPQKSQDSKKTKKQHLPKMTKQEAQKESFAVLPTFDEEDKKPENQETIVKEVEQKLSLDDYAKNLKIIWTSDKQKAVASQYSTLQWHKFKNGTKNRLYNYQINDQSFQYEYVMKFDLEHIIQLNEVQVGLLYNWSTYDPDCQYEPLSFILEGGKNQDQSDWKVLLTPLQDDGYKMNSITVYGYSFVDNLQKGDSLNKTLESIGNRECRYLTMRLRKPIMSCLDQSLYVSCATKAKSYGISYISVMGNQAPKSSHLFSYLVDLQKENSLEVLSKFFSGEFTEAFELISMQPQIIDKIINAFDKLADLLNTKANLIKPIFLAICSKNKDLGDWIMNNRLITMNTNFMKKEQISFLGDIISSNREKQYEKLIQLKDFIIDQINKVAETKSTFNPDQQLLMSRYLKLFTKKLREYAVYVKQQEEGNQTEKEVAFKTQDLDNVIAMLSQCDQSNSKYFNALTGFALILLLPPQPFENKTISVLDYVDKMLNMQENQVQNLLFCSILASTSEITIKNIIEKGKIEWTLDNMKKEPTHTANMFQFAQILFNCSKQQLFRGKYRNTLTFEIYQLLKNTESQFALLKDGFSQDSITLIVQTIKNLAIGGDDEQEKLSNLLKTDLIKASEMGDIELINKVIVPILHAEEKLPITISIMDKNAKNKGLNPIFVGSDAQINKDTFMLKTDILNQKQKTTFSKMFKEIAADKVDSFEKLKDGKWEMIFEDRTHANQDTGKFRKFVNAVSNKQNVIILCSAKVQDQNVVFGGFTNKQFPALGDSWAHEFDYQVPFSEANFVFHYTPDKEHHYTMLHQKPFGYIYTDYEEGGAFSVSGDFFLISWSYEFQNSCGNIYDMKCIEESYVSSFYNNMEIQSIEIWWCNPLAKSSLNQQKLKSEFKKNPNYKSQSPYNFFRDNIVFEISKNATLEHISHEILGKSRQFVQYPGDQVLPQTTDLSTIVSQSNQNDQILDLVILKDESQDQDQKKEATDQEPPQLERNQPILKKFEQKGGIFDLIKAAKAAVKVYKSPKLVEMWTLWLSEIESFSQLPNFFQTFCQDRSKELIIYNLLDGQYDIQDNNQSSPQSVTVIQQQEELHISMVKYSYKIVSQVFETHESAELRTSCLSNGTFQRFLERLGQLSSEKKRTRVTQKAQEEEEVITSSPEKKEEVKKIEQDKKRKGVGYTTGVGTTWNVSEYLKSKEAKSGQAANIVNILKNMIKSKDWEAPIEIKDMLLESALLPTLESAFRSGSLLEMAKDYELNMAYLSFVEELANQQTLIDLLLDIGDEYEPRQKEPIYILLKKIGELSHIFLECLPKEEKEKPGDSSDETQRPKLLGQKIQETNQIVQQKIQAQHSLKNQQSLEEILAMPLSEAYHKLLSDLRFEYMTMKNSSGTYNHAYVGELSKALNPPVTKLVRLAQEIADLSNSLPCDHTNAIFCRVDQDRVDVMKCMIMGAAGTPYAHGAFVYDLFFENNYPNAPPKCQLVTTGGQTVRFNPNLYNNGKVCLSLLGTWRGSSTENWDPKLSTILQVLLSIQAIIMSNEVYFNEPGYEHEQGTTDGERKNEGYSNIVRYCNVKFAMIDAIKNPPAGFEKVIKRSFYLKKNEILREVKEWFDRSKVTDALYTGLVYDHNYHWAPQISAEGKYAEMMEQIYKELKETLESLPSPFEDDSTGQKIERKFSQNEELTQTKEVSGGQSTKIEEIDVSYENNTPLIQQNINIEDDKVKDRWSRYIGAMGIEAVAKQAEARIMICGLGPLGIEVAKNIVLAGCKELILFDDSLPFKEDLAGQFFLTEKDTENSDNRAKCSKEKLQQLNYYVKVTNITDDSEFTTIEDYLLKQKDLKVLVITELMLFSKEQILSINQLCRDKKIVFIYASQNGLFGRIFNDFGEEFTVLDKDGEDLQEVMIENIAWDAQKEATVITLLPGFKHKFEDGDQVLLREVKGMKKLEDENQYINNTVQTIKVLNPTQFTIGEDARLYSAYEGNGTAKQVKVPKKLSFKTIDQATKATDQDSLFDQNMLVADFEKLELRKNLHLIYNAMFEISSQSIQDEEPPENYSEITFVYEQFVKPQTPSDYNEDQIKKLRELSYVFSMTGRFCLPPLCAFLGGLVSQEIVKGITQKYTPIKQYMYMDCVELFQWENLASLMQTYEQDVDDNKHRYSGLEYMLGKDLMQKIQNCKLFMIGAGAIGCELLKNYAMVGLGTGKEGHITLTDPDVIEVSNLNRQFLFREKHLRKPKSQTAAAAAIQMNPSLKNHIIANLDKIHDGTAHIYNESFFASQTIVTNALDNIQARLYIDQKCVSARTPLIDSGTLGSKGHVQIVLPNFKTESYGSMNDPEDNTEIPHCTLKMFPEEILHCIEWAKDIFGNQFTLKPQSFNKLVVDSNEVNFFDQQELVAVKKAIKLIEKKPKDFADCLRLARSRFQKHFVNDIKQLLHVYPLDKMTKEGRPFWSLPKRPPHAVEFDPKDQVHATFVSACACLLARLYKVEIPYENPRDKEIKFKMAEIAATFEQPEFIPNDLKANEIQSQVEKQNKSSEELKEEETQIEQAKVSDNDQVKQKYSEVIQPLKPEAEKNTLSVEEFEKDNDQNFHIDFIYAMSNIRASNYNLEGMDWINVKIKAGRIVPALATTTAAIAGLQTLELLKYLKSCKLEEHRNSFLNLAVPSLMMSEPAPAQKTKLKEGLEVTLWDRWELETSNKEITVKEIIEHFETKYSLKSRDVFYGSIPLFLQALQGKDPSHLKKTLMELIHTPNKDKLQFIDLTITFVGSEDEEKMLEGIPPIRIIFK